MRESIRLIFGCEFIGSDSNLSLVNIDHGNVDALLEKMRPQIQLSSGNTYTIKKMGDFRPEMISQKLELASNEDITSVLHDAMFQAIEASCRGLEFVCSKCHKWDNVQLQVLNCNKENVLQQVHEHVFIPDYKNESDVPSTLVFLDMDFTHDEKNFSIFKNLARMGETLQMPIVAQTTEALFGLKHLLHLPTISNPLERLKSRQHDQYHAFRETETSRWATLMINRFLLRPPYSSGEYSEPASAKKPSEYLWGRAIWFLAANAVQSYIDKGHLIGLSGLGTGGEQTGLPVRELPLSRKETIKTPLEASFPIDVTESLPYFGISPLTQIPHDLGGQNQKDMAYVHLAANMRRFPDPEEKQYAILSVYATLAYSLTMGMITNYAIRFTAGSHQGQSPKEVAMQLKTELVHFLMCTEEEIVIETLDEGLSIDYKPATRCIHSKFFEISLNMPL